MKRFIILPLLCATLPAFSATIYQCQINGSTIYTQSPRGHCQNANLGRPSVYTPVHAPAAVTPSENTANSSENENDGNNNQPSDSELATAEKALAQAKQNLEEGKKVRYGNERNYARYLERIQGLENAVKQAQEQLNHLNK